MESSAGSTNQIVSELFVEHHEYIRPVVDQKLLFGGCAVAKCPLLGYAYKKHGVDLDQFLMCTERTIRHHPSKDFYHT